jgi:tetratricopeptide (TPR) repeat protein
MRRLNVKLTLWLIGITVFSVVSVHFLHAYQIDRNAGVLKVLAEQAVTDGDKREAVKQYNQYLRHRDDPQAYSVLAGLVVDIANDTDANRQDKYRAYTILQEAIRRHPELDDVRHRLVDYTLKIGGFAEAAEHIQYLINQGPKTPDLDYKMARCNLVMGEKPKALERLYGLVGYDPRSEQFSSDVPPAAQKDAPVPEAFELLANLLYRETNGAKVADQVMLQLVKWNDTATAHLMRANYLQATAAAAYKPDSEEFAAAYKEAKKELDRAVELEPDTPEVLLQAAGYAMAERKLDKAEELLNAALKEHPERQDVYLRFYQLKLMQNDLAGAAEHLKLGLKKAQETSLILEKLADIQFQMNDLDAVRETVKLMNEKGTFNIELLRFEEARLKFADADYMAASRALEAARPAFLRISNSLILPQIDVMLGHSYEALGQWDRALELYRGLLQKSPDLLRPRLGEAAALQNLGRYEEAATSVNVLTANAQKLPAIRPQVLQLLINEQVQKPEEEREWSTAEEVAALIYEEPGRSELDKTLLKVDMLTVENELAQAQEILKAACKQYPKETRPWLSLARLMTRDPSTLGKVGRLLDLAEEKLGDIMQLRLERIRTIVRDGGDDATAKLKKLEQGIDKFTKPEQETLLLQLGAAYMQLSDYQDAKRCWELAVENDPKKGPTRQFLFELAFDNKDEETMHQVVKGLRESPNFGPQSPLYKYCAAAAILWPINTRKKNSPGPLTPEERKSLGDARRLVDEGLAIRTEWSVLWRVKGEIEQLEGDAGGIARAITAYQRAIDCSHSGQGTVARRLVQLLYATNRISEANDVLKYVGQTTDQSDMWRRTVEDIMFKDGKTDEALELASKDVEKDPENPAARVWFGQFLERAGRFDDAEVEYRKAVDLAPEMPQSWDLLVRRMVASKKLAEAAETVREAAKPLGKNPIGLARLYERINDFPHAEEFYKTALDEHPEDLPRVRQLVDFYFNTNQMPKAMPYLNQIIEKTAKSTDKLELQQLAAARRAKARIVASVGDYEHILEATKLIEQNTEGGGLSAEDTQAIVLMLATRPEPESRAKALQLLEQLQVRRPLQPREQAILGQLYDRAGKWDKGRDLMVTAVGRKSDDVDILYPFAQMLLLHGEYEDAGRWIDRLDDLINTSKTPVPNTFKQSVAVLRARLLVQNGQKEEAFKTLDGLLPRPLPPNQLRVLGDVSRLMEELDLLDGAEKLLTEFVGQDPRGVTQMAAFVGRRGNVDKAFELLEQGRKSEPIIAILPTAMECLRRNPDQATKERFQLLEGWAKQAAEEEANPQQIRMILAELYDLEGNSQAAIQTYRDVLADPNVSDMQKALVKNNLAFLLATVKARPDSPAEAARLVSEAIRVLGPTADLLDTRAVTLLAQGKAEQAIADLLAATSDSPSSSKFFHLAQAQKLANDPTAARQSLAKAEELGVTGGQLGPSEQKLYKQLADELH